VIFTQLLSVKTCHFYVHLVIGLCYKVLSYIRVYLLTTLLSHVSNLDINFAI